MKGRTLTMNVVVFSNVVPFETRIQGSSVTLDLVSLILDRALQCDLGDIFKPK